MSDPQDYQKIRKELNFFKTELQKYIAIYEADGEIDSKERLDLDKRISAIYKLEIQLNQLAGENPDPIRWSEIENEYQQNLNSYIHQAMTASDRAKNYIASTDESKSGSMVISAMLSIIGSYGPQYTIAVEIYKAAASAMQSSPPDNLTDFHAQWIDNLEAQQNKKTGFSDFKNFFTKEYLQGCTENQVTHSTVLSLAKNYIDRHFLTRKQMEQFYVRSWIDSAKDEYNWMGFNDNDDEAGYFQINVRYQYPLVTLLNASSVDQLKDGLWFKDELYIDDMARPKGTNNALAGVYGSSKKLAELPFKIKVNFQVTPYPGTRALGWVGTCLFERSKTGSWTVKMGNKTWLDFFINNCLNGLTVKDLGVE